MINDIDRKRLYREAFSILESAQKLLAEAEIRHLKAVAVAEKKAA